MYHIYHIPTIKIGVSKRPKARVKSQGFTDYEVLESHWDIDVVSKREQELQKQYGLPVDKTPYNKSYYNIRKGTTKQSLSKGGKTKRKYHGQKTTRIQVFLYESGKEVGIYESIAETARQLGLYRGNIYNMLIGRHGAKQHKGYVFREL